MASSDLSASVTPANAARPEGAKPHDQQEHERAPQCAEQRTDLHQDEIDDAGEQHRWSQRQRGGDRALLRGAGVEPMLERARITPENLQQASPPTQAAPLLEMLAPQ